MLIAYWFDVTQGPGYGVTAESKDAAERLLAAFGYPRDGIRITAITENVRFPDLDQNHVVPNAGPMVVRGVWFPRHNV